MTTKEPLEARIAALEARLVRIESQSVHETVELKGVIKKRLSLREFMNSKLMTSEVQKTLAIAYYLEIHDGMSSFNAQDIKKGYSLAKEPSPRNINDTINKNIQKGYLMDADEKKEGNKAWTLTNSGIGFLEAELVSK
jgi:hypothetical protein